VALLIGRARAGSRDSLGRLLDLYRNYLTILAATQLDRRVQRRISPSDAVQEAMLAAHRDFASFRGASQPEFLAWLRQILVNYMHHAVDAHIKARKRDVRCEIPMEQMARTIDQSALNLGQILAHSDPSPSASACRREESLEVADQLARLKPEYRDVIVLRNLQGLSFEEVGARMDRKPGAVRMLWLRAIEKFKQLYEAQE
jgi:RNA polymerase sigma-70 factor (ECF subfamily)